MRLSPSAQATSMVLGSTKRPDPMDDALARKTGDVLAGTADIFSFNGYGLHPLFGQGPGDEFAARPAA
jgi:hypothetical protein